MQFMNIAFNAPNIGLI